MAIHKAKVVGYTYNIYKDEMGLEYWYKINQVQPTHLRYCGKTTSKVDLGPYYENFVRQPKVIGLDEVLSEDELLELQQQSMDDDLLPEYIV